MRSFLLVSVFLQLLTGNILAQKTAAENVVIIPVVVHVVYNTPQQNISFEQIKSQIAVLNNDYRKKNKDIIHIPSAFKPLAADSRIEFRLASEDPAGIVSDGIVRVATPVTAFGRDDKIKHAAYGGSNAWNRDQYLNIYVANLSNGILGYASSPGCAPENDGVVISYDVFGTTANVRSPYNKGRTTVHEVGHWLGLKHIWGDKDCGDDNIDDTPPQAGPTRGCPSGVIATCSSGAAGNMYMNFMDFTNDDCVNMFTAGQVNKMHELFQTGGAREALLYSNKAANSTEENNSALDLAVDVYPNPAVEELNIKSIYLGKSLRIYNHLGQLCKQITINKTVEKLNVRELRPGLYFISIGDKKVHKFVKG